MSRLNQRSSSTSSSLCFSWGTCRLPPPSSPLSLMLYSRLLSPASSSPMRTAFGSFYSRTTWVHTVNSCQLYASNGVWAVVILYPCRLVSGKASDTWTLVYIWWKERCLGLQELCLGEVDTTIRFLSHIWCKWTHKFPFSQCVFIVLFWYAVFKDTKLLPILFRYKNTNESDQTVVFDLKHLRFYTTNSPP